MLVAWMWVWGVSGWAAAAEPSFDCSRAGTDVERAVCDDGTLGLRDRVLSDMFRSLRDGSGPYAGLVTPTQRAWSALRDAGCKGAEDLQACVAIFYDHRIAELAVWGGWQLGGLERGVTTLSSKNGSLYLAATPGGGAAFWAETVGGPSAATCTVDGLNLTWGPAATLEWRDADCLLSMQVQERRVEMTPTAACDRWCGMGAELRGTFLRK